MYLMCMFVCVQTHACHTIHTEIRGYTKLIISIYHVRLAGAWHLYSLCHLNSLTITF